MLDTNAWLDLLVFRDPRVHRLAVALEDGHARALVQPAMRAELERVLAYPALALDDARRAGLLQRFSTLCVPVDTVAPVAAPRCSDADDQMFVDLALAARAHALLSRDEALLRLAPRLRAHGIQVASPADWCAAGGALQISKR